MGGEGIHNVYDDTALVADVAAVQATVDAIEEDVDAIGLSFLINNEWEFYVPPIMEGLRNHGMEDVAVFIGGLILPEDVPKLEQMGVKGIFTSANKGDKIVSCIRETVTKQKGDRKKS